MLQRVFEVQRMRCRSLVRLLAHGNRHVDGSARPCRRLGLYRPVPAATGGQQSVALFSSNASSSSSSASASASASGKRFKSTSAAATAAMVPEDEVDEDAEDFEEMDEDGFLPDDFVLENEEETFSLELERADWALEAYSIDAPFKRLHFDLNREQGAQYPNGDYERSSQELLKGMLQQDRDFYERRKFDMNEEEVNDWLRNHEIPQEYLDQCSTVEEVAELRQLFARQLRLEQSIRTLATKKRLDSVHKVRDLGKGSRMGASQRLVMDWMKPLTRMIQEEKDQIKAMTRQTKDSDTLDRMAYGAMFMMLDADVMAAIALNVMLNLTLSEVQGVKFIKVALDIGKAVQEEIMGNMGIGERDEKRQAEKRQKYRERIKKQMENRPHVGRGRKATPESIPDGPIKVTLERKVDDYFDSLEHLDKRIILKTGAALVDFVQRSCQVPDNLIQGMDEKRARDKKPEEGKGKKKEDSPKFAFTHSYKRSRENGKQRRTGMISCDESIIRLVISANPGDSILPWTARYLPMLVPPRDWDGVTNGGYYTLHTKILRQRDSVWQLDCVRQGEMKPLVDALNSMQRVPWRINKEVLDVILKVWARGDEFGDLPQRKKIRVGPMRENMKDNPEKMKVWLRHVAKVNKMNRELHSLQCDTKYKLQVAEEFSEEKEIYYPYNMDFRGRVYPIPPNLNHLGSDLSRSLLVFRDRKPLGKSGMRWLKIHLANVYGVDKCSFDERVAFSETNMDKIMASAANPLGNHPDEQWWQHADYPFLALGVCFEIRRALESGDPESYMSNLPVHQDGSCNGLQHYAALGRDATGGAQVNLVPGPKPSDVYSGVAHQVIRKVEADAAMEIPHEGYYVDFEDKLNEHNRVEELRMRKKHANFLLGNITRKVVKQTVMTSVYGVTYIGARKQIQARLEETFIKKGHMVDKDLEDEIYGAACYAAELTMSSMTDLFNSARTIMGWLGQCASIVALEGQAMSWVTPLGLPVVQPYRRAGSQQVRTRVQHVLLSLTESRPVSAGRQRSAFPPNFVHSLDSTHMLLTAKRCLDEEGIAFAAVHDSYWTHASSVETMNHILREEFVNLYSQPILEDLRDQLVARFPEADFPKIPERGSLDLKCVLDSPYFFN